MECVAYGYLERVHEMMMTAVAVTLFKIDERRQGGLRRCGLTPGLAPRMLVVTEDDVLRVKPGRTCDSTAKGYMKIHLVLK